MELKALSHAKPAHIPARVARRIVWTLFAAQSLGSTALLAAATVNSIAGQRLAGSAVWATLPEGVYHLGTAAGALGWGVGLDRLGWRQGLAAGLSLGAVGALLAAAGIEQSSLGGFLSGLVLMGLANAGLRLARFAAAEAESPERRAQAIARVVLGGAAASLLWTGLARGGGALAEGMDRIADTLIWPYLAGAGLFGLAAGVSGAGLPGAARRLTGRTTTGGASEPAPAGSLARVARRPGVWVAASAMVVSQAVMVAVMVVTPLHMDGHARGVEEIAQVLSGHVFGMYAFSFPSGRLADHLGRGPVLAVGGGVLAAGCLLASVWTPMAPLGLGLFLLGLGWNLCYVGGSSLLADHLAAAERSRVQGFNDLLLGLVSAGGSLLSGVTFAAVGFVTVSVAGAVAAGGVVALGLRWQRPGTGSGQGHIQDSEDDIAREKP
jgi:MFS family permease